jgi:hypothetical protein
MRSQNSSTRVLMYFYELICLNLGGSLFMRKNGTAVIYVCYLGEIISTEFKRKATWAH